MRELCSALQPAGALVNRQAHHACALLARPQGRACGPAGSRAARLGTRLQPAPSRAHECTSARGQGRPRPSPNPGPRRRRSRATRATRPATPPRSAPRSTACWAATSATSTWSARAWRRTGACSACACTGRRSVAAALFATSMLDPKLLLVDVDTADVMARPAGLGIGPPRCSRRPCWTQAAAGRRGHGGRRSAPRRARGPARSHGSGRCSCVRTLPPRRCCQCGVGGRRCATHCVAAARPRQRVKGVNAIGPAGAWLALVDKVACRSALARKH